MIIAIDGPAGAGKSSAARALAQRLGFRYVDTGAMYRAVTWLALERGVSLDDGAALGELAAGSSITLDRGRVTIAGVDVTDAIRSPRIDRSVSAVARHAALRDVLRSHQRALAESGDAVVEGRDIGTVVLPQADVKVFLVAEEGERARRRHAERPEAGEETLADLRLRDALDSGQMQRASDAEVIDTTDLTLDEVVARIVGLVAERTGA